MEIKRDLYLQKLVDRMHNGLIKIITGVKRCGKSYLVFKIFADYLRENGVQDDHIISMALDVRENEKYRDPDVMLSYIKNSIRKDGKFNYILLDEIQLLDDFEAVLNSVLHIPNTDVYVTGSNSKFLSSDVITEFRGRGDEVRVYPLSFSEH